MFCKNVGRGNKTKQKQVTG